MNGYLRAGRMVWVIVGLFALAVAAVAALLVSEFVREAETAARQQAESLARGAEVALNRNLIAFDLALAGLAEQPDLFPHGDQRIDAVRAPDILRRLVSQRLLMRDLLLLDASGRVTAAGDESVVRRGVALPSGFLAEALAQTVPHLAISRPATYFSTGEKVLFFARPLGPPGSARLLAVAVVPVSALTTILAPSVQVDGLSIALEDDQGVLLASVPANDSLLGRRRAPSLADQATGPSRPTPGRLDDAPTYASARPTIYRAVLVTAGISESAALAHADAARITTLGFAAVFIGLAVAVGALAQTYLGRLMAASAETADAKLVLEEALASMDEGFLLWDADDRVVSWNERYLALFPHLRGVIAQGVSQQAVAQAGARAFLPHGSEAQRRAWIEERMARRRGGGMAFEQRGPDGRVVSVSERRTAGGGLVSVYRDVTHARAEAEELRRARHTAEAANEAKSRFLATMSHEIRTPLNGVLGMNALLLETPLDDRQRVYAETIRSSGEALLTVINDVLDMSKLEAGRMNIELAPFAPAALVDEVVVLLGARASGKGISLTVEHDAGLPAVLIADAGRIRQVLFNLVGNAIKFTERGGVVVSSRQRDRGDGRIDWTVVVRDTGVGIAAEAMPTLFDRFTQADSGTSRRFGGTGLGLAISRQLVELMGGRLEVDSRLGEGSEFRMTLALAPGAANALGGPAAPSPAPAPQAPAAARGLRILVAEDHPVNQMLLAAMLDQLGHVADVVANGREALHQVQQAPYDLVLMDIQMPEMDGVTAARAIRQLPGPAGQLPIISVSANALSEQRASYLAVGICDHVTKPYDLTRLAQAIAGAVAPA